MHTSVLGWLSAQFFMYVVEGKSAAGWRANKQMLPYLICVLTQLYIYAVGWLWQQHRTLLRLGGFGDALLAGGNHAPHQDGCLESWFAFAFALAHAMVADLMCLVKLFQWIQLLLKSLQEKLLSVTVRPLEQEPHSPCVYSKGCLAIWKVSSLFISNTRKSFLCVSWERKPQKFPLLSMYSAQNTLSGNACSCLKVCWKLCSL